MPATTVQAVCHFSEIRPRRYHHCRAINLMGSSKHAVSRAYCNLSFLSSQQPPKLTAADISHSQQNDLCIGEVWHAVIQNSADHANKGKHPDVPLLLKEWEKLEVKDLLYRMTKLPSSPVRQETVAPT